MWKLITLSRRLTVTRSVSVFFNLLFQLRTQTFSSGVCEERSRDKRKVSIGLSFLTWPDTQLQMMFFHVCWMCKQELFAEGFVTST